MDIAATSSVAHQALRLSEAATVLQHNQENESDDKVESRAADSDVPPGQRATSKEDGQSPQPVIGALETAGQSVENGQIGRQVDIQV